VKQQAAVLHHRHIKTANDLNLCAAPAGIGTGTCLSGNHAALVLEIPGAGDGIRTRDTLLGRQEL
jgi:hypothetical protein